ncbi:fructosamine kinase family protein [Flavobacteriaceae bacterium GF1]
MDASFIHHVLGEKPIAITSVSGGDIAQAFKVETGSQDYFVKSASFQNARDLLQKEALGLQKLASTHTIAIPEVLGLHHNQGTAYLFLRFIISKNPSNHDMEVFGRALTGLHEIRFGTFGLETDNFIGKLPQSNTVHQNWVDFYVQERLHPQLKMALDLGKLDQGSLPSITKMGTCCEALFGEVNASLLHGDLWSGNYLISNEGIPYLIDPAVYYGHNEVDLAMTKLFGGFSSTFYGAYHEVIPPHPNQKALVDIYQLYYLLVHLNLFGVSYLGPVLRILKRYFG